MSRRKSGTHFFLCKKVDNSLPYHYIEMVVRGYYNTNDVKRS